jgi:hypothetical protein
MLACTPCQQAGLRVAHFVWGRTCKMASLCISCPAHAGIISLSTLNSSFILDRRLRSIRLCAVLRAIFLPAAVVVPDCFLLPAAPAADADLAGDVGDAAVLGCSCDSFGFIWMILRERVGGGGSE